MAIESGLGIVSWIIFGAIAGWIATTLVGGGERNGCVTNILVGVVGAFVGGFLFSQITGRAVLIGFDLSSFAVAVIGAIVLLVVLRLVQR
ncbi:MAG TPA: GlsB/YeaQ/YmgE family stress response membrane protein [Thermomicrobiales bacterium]|nr:GlsB/YeaQ/YmgE family stress response membrane protein [Thermomicrobiales bacterium]